LLYAPQSGKKTRELIGKRAGEGKDYLVDRSKELRDQAGDYIEKGKDLVSEQYDRGKELVAKQKEQLSAAFYEGKDGYREAKKAAH